MLNYKYKMIHQIYILAIMTITVIILIYYYSQEADYKRELDKIDRLEKKQFARQRELEIIRTQTMPCQMGNFTTPKSCYFDSGYACTWNELTNRCDSK